MIPSGIAYVGVRARWPEEMRNPTRLTLSWNTLIRYVDGVTNIAVLLPTLWGQIGDGICPMKAWYVAMEVNQLSYYKL